MTDGSERMTTADSPPPVSSRISTSCVRAVIPESTIMARSDDVVSPARGASWNNPGSKLTINVWIV